jgi:hypothetical protein
MCFILTDLKCYGALPQALVIIFEMQRNRINEKITRRKISFATSKIRFKKNSSLRTPPTFNPHSFLISYSF